MLVIFTTYVKVFDPNTDILNHLCVCSTTKLMPWSQGWWLSPWWPWSWRWRWSGLRILQQGKSDHMQACPLPSLSFLSLPDVYMLFACLLKEGSHLLPLLLTLVLVLLVILHLYAAGCPAYCSLSYLSCCLATFSWLDASCVQLYVDLFPLLVVTLLRHVCKMLMHCVWLCYHSSTKHLHAAIGYTF